MIGSLMSRMGMAEKLSVAQLQKAVQDGTLPAYIGVPLMQDKMQQEQAAKAAAAGIQQQKQPPIAQQVMQEAQAQEQARGVEALPSNLPETESQAMAGGGIVAFAAGGDAEDDDDETDDVLEERMRSAETQKLFDIASSRLGQRAKGLEGLQNAGVGISAALPPAGYKGEGIKPPEGVEGLKAYILQKESRGQRYDKAGNLLTSPKGAQGEMQVMPGTARDPGFGVTPARDNSPEELRRVGDEYVAALYKEFGDPKLAAMAYNWGPGNVKKWIAGGMKGPVPKETQQYVASLAQGGKVRHLDIGGFLGSLVETPIQHIQSAGNTYSQHPEQALMGINTPAEAYAWNSVLGTNYKPTANMLGGPSETAYAEGAKNGVNMQAGHVADSVAPAVIGAFTGGVGGAGASAGNALGKGYEMNQMRSEYYQNPTAFQNRYGMIKGINYAGGGIVALAAGGTPDVYTDPMGGAVPGQEPDYSQKGPGLFNDIAQWWKEHSYGTPESIKKEEEDKKKIDDAKKADEAKKAGPEIKEVPPLLTQPSGGAGVDALTKTPEDSVEKKYLEMLANREASSANQRSIDNYMALMQAGLGMMGSKSLVPLQAIGEGASSGIAAKLAAEKTRAAEEAATLKGYGTLHSIQQNAALRRDLAAQSGDERKTKTLGVLQQNELKNVLNLNKLDMNSMTDPNIANKINQQVQQNLSKNPGYRKIYEDVYGAPFVPEPVAASAVNYTSTYGLTPQPKK
jgi:soluble lytic murein transglycosylase-like protein